MERQRSSPVQQRPLFSGKHRAGNSPSTSKSERVRGEPDGDGSFSSELSLTILPSLSWFRCSNDVVVIGGFYVSTYRERQATAIVDSALLADYARNPRSFRLPSPLALLVREEASSLAEEVLERGEINDTSVATPSTFSAIVSKRAPTRS